METKKKIVIIDDEKDLCFLMQDILERTGRFRVLSAYSGLEGQELCLKERPDLIFLDFIMPQVTGPDVAKFLKANPSTADIPIIVISGQSRMEEFKPEENQRDPDALVREGGENFPEKMWRKFSSELAHNLGIEAYLPKPFSKSELLEITEKVLKEKE